MIVCTAYFTYIHASIYDQTYYIAKQIQAMQAFDFLLDKVYVFQIYVDLQILIIIIYIFTIKFRAYHVWI